ncbi:MAG: hypothetical protein WC389_22375, partial [Lutibacter sp.]
MFLIRDAYATIWDWEDKGKYAKVRIGTSEKNKQSGEYENSNWFATFVGDAHTKVLETSEKDRITIKSGKINNLSKKQDDGKYKNYLNVVIFDFELSDVPAKKSSSSSNKSSSKSMPPI